MQAPCSRRPPCARPCRSPCGRQSRIAETRHAPARTSGRGAPWPGWRPPRWLHQRIALDDGLGRNIQHGRRLPSTSTITGLSRSPMHGTAHGQQRGLQDVELVDFFHAGLGNAAAQALARISSYSFSRRAAVSFLESARPAIGCRSSRMTAAATTGPASGPRPASSTPATRPGGCQGRQACSGSEDFSGSHRQPVGGCCAAGFRAAQ
jgi:hypothetical protein